MRRGAHPSDQDHKHYYVMESVGIAAGFLLAALHMAGLATLMIRATRFQPDGDF